MARGIATPKQTSGGGFTFEEKVCATFLSQMLAEHPPLDVDLGTVTRVDFQGRVDGWFFDDAILTMESAAGSRTCAVSVKSNSQFSSSGDAPSDFVSDSWEQFLNIGTDKFSPERDLICLVTGPLDSTLRSAIQGVLRKAIATEPSLLPERFAQKGWANDAERSLFASFACPAGIESAHRLAEEDTGRLLSRIRMLHADFEDVSSEWESAGVQRCRGLLVSGSIDEGQQLWNQLKTLAAELRHAAGGITREELLDRLRFKFSLHGRAVHNRDWTRLALLARSGATAVPDMLAQRVRLNRAECERRVLVGLRECSLFLAGASGTGKSAVARHVAEEHLSSNAPCIWLNASTFAGSDFAALQTNLGTAHPLCELVAAISSSRGYLFLDGLDRLYDSQSFSVVKQLLSLFRLDHRDTPWRVLVTCQAAEVGRVQAALLQAGIDTSAWRMHQLSPVDPKELEPMWRQFPALRPLRFNEKLRPLLSNLKILDLIATQALLSSDTLPASDWVGETSVASWYWRSVVSSGPSGSARSRLAMSIAEHQADRLVPTAPTTGFTAPELDHLDGLVTQRICFVEDEQISFQHDLFGDWARLRILMARGADVSKFVPEKLDSPLWHRAIRLFGVHLLEKGDDLAAWRQVFSALAGHLLAQDLLLESLLFATTSEELLTRLRDDLFAAGGNLLIRLLGRCLVSSTVPDPYGVAVAGGLGMEASEAAALFRYPRWQHWLPLMRFMDANSNACVECAPLETARAIELTLKHAPPGHSVRLEAARLGIQLGDAALAARRDYGNPARDQRTLLYKVALAGAAEIPDEVKAFALASSCRSGAPRPLQKLAPRRGLSSLQSFPAVDEIPPPWPEGPNAEVDEEFRRAVLTSGLAPLIQQMPEVAREVALACLISERTYSEENDYQRVGKDVGLEAPSYFHPPLYTVGPFLMFLREKFGEGLALIDQLVTFAYERRLERDRRWAETRADREPPIDHSIELELEAGARRVRGDFACFSWSAGHTAAPRSVHVALMALEAYFYQRLERAEPIEQQLARVLVVTRTVAPLGVLCEVGKKKPELFEGVLRPLLQVPEVFDWSLHAGLQDRSHMMFGIFDETTARLAREFHNQEHRRKDLRQLAARLFYFSAPMREFLTAARISWQEQLAKLPEHERDSSVVELCLWFDIDNCVEIEHPERGLLIVNRALQEMQEREAPRAAKHLARVRLATFPIQCRRILDGEAETTAEDWAEHWTYFEELAADGASEPDPEELKGELSGDLAASIAGWTAVAARMHYEHFRMDGSRLDAAIARLLEMVSSPPAPTFFDSEHSVCNWTWDAFAADALPALLAAAPDNPKLRKALASLCFVKSYHVVRVLMCRLYGEPGLRSDFYRLRHLLMRWAHLRDRIQSCQHVGRSYSRISKEEAESVLQTVGREVERLIEQFVTKSLPTECRTWSELDYEDLFSGLDQRVPMPPNRVCIDIETVVAAHAWIPALSKARDEAERGEWCLFWREALQHVMRLVRPDDDRYHQLPDAYRWVLCGAGANLAWMSEAEKPHEVWKPVLELPREYDNWTAAFLSGFHEARLVSLSAPPMAAAHLRSMFEFSLDQQPAWTKEREAWASLLGLDQITQFRWEPRHASMALSMAEFIARWTEARQTCWGSLECLATWLRGEPARPLMLGSLSWILSATRRLGDRDFLRDRAMSAVATLLRETWRHKETEMRGDADAMLSFKALLRWLVDEQHPTALALASEIGAL